MKNKVSGSKRVDPPRILRLEGSYKEIPSILPAFRLVADFLLHIFYAKKLYYAKLTSLRQVNFVRQIKCFTPD